MAVGDKSINFSNLTTYDSEIKKYISTTTANAVSGKADTSHTHGAVTGLTVSGKTITFTKDDGSEGTITTQDTNTTYKTGTASTAGITKLYTGTGTNTDGTMTQKAIKSKLDGKANTSHTHGAVTGLTVSGKTITFTKDDGSEGTITTQDTNTTYNTGTASTAGITKLYTDTGTNTDGTMTQKAINSKLDGKLSLSGGTMTGDAVMKTGTDYSTARARNIKAGTTDLTAGSSSLDNGSIYLVYE